MLTFKQARATTTRLMGVVGVVAYWRDEMMREVVQIYHLDYESYGIDGFHHLIEPDEETLETLILGVTGGLGGGFVDIDERAFNFLVKSSYIVDEACLDALVDFECFEDQFESLYVDLTLEEEIQLYEYLSPPIQSPIHLLNYFVMRYVGCDYPSMLALWQPGHLDEGYEISSGPHTLIKHTSTLISSHLGVARYRSEALVDCEDRYQIVVSEISVDERTLKVTGAKRLETMNISSIEAAFNLNVPEYLLILSIKDAFFHRRFARNNPEMMKQNYPAGQLYIEFNPNNEHVADNPYFLSGDVYAMYFFGAGGQMIVCTLKEENLLEIDQLFLENNAYEESFQRICEIKTENPMLLTYINSAYDSIFDFFSAT